jgi:hypothetical protein
LSIGDRLSPSVPLSLGRGVRGEGLPCRVALVVHSVITIGLSQVKSTVNLLSSPPTPLPRERGDDAAAHDPDFKL